jgi:hypothetical protein
LSALLVTSKGSIIPLSIIFTISPVITLTPIPSSGVPTSSSPALFSIVLNGALIASRRIFSPTLLALVLLDASSKAIPPPDTIPSFTAALVAQIASSTLSDFSFNSISEFAPTFTTDTLLFQDV